MQCYCVHFFEDKYMSLFLGNIDLRPSCYACHFKGIPRVSDITIGDSWGIEKAMPDMDDDKGTSIILIHSSNGERMFREIKENLITRATSLNEILPPTADSRRSVEMHPNRKKYLKGIVRGENFDVLYGYIRKNFIQKAVRFIRYLIIR